MKKLLLGSILIGTIIVMATVATRSYLRSQAVSQDNVISTGTVEVMLSDLNETEQVTIGGSWGHLNSAAGEILAETEIKIHNKGSLNSNYLDIKFEVQGDTELAKHIFFEETKGLLLGSVKDESDNLVLAFLGMPGYQYRIEQPIGSALAGIDGLDGTSLDGRISLSELSAAGTVRYYPMASAEPMRAGSTASLWINAYLDPELAVGGQSISTAISFALEQ